MCYCKARSLADQEHGLAEQLGNLFEDDDGMGESALGRAAALSPQVGSLRGRACLAGEPMTRGGNGK
jgi:hypothetical protein